MWSSSCGEPLVLYYVNPSILCQTKGASVKVYCCIIFGFLHICNVTLYSIVGGRLNMYRHDSLFFCPSKILHYYFSMLVNNDCTVITVYCCDGNDGAFSVWE